MASVIRAVSSPVTKGRLNGMSVNAVRPAAGDRLRPRRLPRVDRRVSRITYGGRCMDRKWIRPRYSPITPRPKSWAPARIEISEARNAKPGAAASDVAERISTKTKVPTPNSASPNPSHVTNRKRLRAVSRHHVDGVPDQLAKGVVGAPLAR